MSDNGFAPFIWGPHLWKYLHIMSFNYPRHPTERHKRTYYDFIKAIGNTLPCKHCRRNYESHLLATKFIRLYDVYPEALRNRDTFTYWMFTLHNCINKDANTSWVINYEDVVQYYESIRT
jgi:hypothetical protein